MGYNIIVVDAVSTLVLVRSHMHKSRVKDLIGYSFLVVFANDHTIDENEIAMLEKLALEDGVVDEDEKEVLRKIFSRVSKEQLADKVWHEIAQFRQEYDI